MHKIKIRNLKRNEVGKFDPEISDWRNPYKAVLKFDDLLKLPELAHYDGIDNGWIMTNEEKEALTSGKNLMIPASFVIGLNTLDESLGTVRAIVRDLVDSAKTGAEATTLDK